MLTQFSPIELLIYYIIAINFMSFAAFGIDKSFAEAGSRRISEMGLLRLSAFGGTPGAWAGRSIFRHKTRKNSFSKRLQAITVAQLVVIGVIGYAGLHPDANTLSAKMVPLIGGERATLIGPRYSRCDEVRAAGQAPLYRGEPGYSERMDSDLDGIACEPVYKR